MCITYVNYLTYHYLNFTDEKGIKEKYKRKERNKIHSFKNNLASWACWYLFVIPALRRQRQESHRFGVQRQTLSQKTKV
jgi:hypothetical protein